MDWFVVLAGGYAVAAACFVFMGKKFLQMEEKLNKSIAQKTLLRRALDEAKEREERLIVALAECENGT